MTQVSELVFKIWERRGECSEMRRAQFAVDAFAIREQGAGAALLPRFDVAVAELRRALFGADVEMVVQCPACDMRFDLPLRLDELETSREAPERILIEEGEFSAELIMPQVDDLEALVVPPDDAALAEELFSRCVARAEQGGREIGTQELPASFRRLASDALTALGAEGLTADLSCSACGHDWRAPIDVVGALLRDIDLWTLARLEEVHRLALVYHWSEGEILALSPQRRRYYLEAIG
jgi:hypothetical protein